MFHSYCEAPPTAVEVIGNVAAPIHLSLMPEMVGRATGAEVFIVTLMAYPLLTHPVVELVTVRVPVYVPTAAAPGTTRIIGLAGNTALATFTKPCPRAPALYTMLYLSGPLVVAL